MPKLESLQKIREMIREQMAANMAAQSSGNPTPLHNALTMINQNTMWRLTQWVHDIILPKIAQSRGAETQDYTNYSEIRDSLIWSMYILQQYEEVLTRYGRQRQLLRYYQKENARMENELLKYAAVEQLASNEAAAMYMQSIVKRAINLMESKPNNNENAKLQ